jgi:hypothetical protein
MTVVQDFVAYCERNQMPSDELDSAVFYASRREFASRRGEGTPVTPGEWQELLDFTAPDVPPAACPAWAGRA